MSLQICAHHPLGTHEDVKGSWSNNINHWKVSDKVYNELKGTVMVTG